MECGEFFAGVRAEIAVRIGADEFTELGGGLFAVAEIVVENFGFDEEGLNAQAAAGILLAEEFVLADGILKQFGFGEEAALLGEQLGNGGDGGVGFP